VRRWDQSVRAVDEDAPLDDVVASSRLLSQVLAVVPLSWVHLCDTPQATVQPPLQLTASQTTVYSSAAAAAAAAADDDDDGTDFDIRRRRSLRVNSTTSSLAQ